MGKEQGDADVVADFDELQVRTIVQVKHYLKEVDEAAVRQIVDAKSYYDDSNYTLILWVVAACDSFTEQAQRYAEENGVRLIGGSEFASSLMDVEAKEAISEKATVQGKSCTKSPKGPVMMRVIGKNIVAMAAVAMNIGMNSSLALLTAASKGL